MRRFESLFRSASLVCAVGAAALAATADAQDVCGRLAAQRLARRREDRVRDAYCRRRKQASAGFLRGPRDDLADAGLADRRGLSFACELERQGARDRRRRIRRQPSRRGRGGRSRARLCGDRKRPRPRERKRARSVVRDRRRWQAERRRHHRLRPPRYTSCDDDGQGNRRATLRPRAASTRTGKAARRAAAKASPRSSAIRTTTTA